MTIKILVPILLGILLFGCASIPHYEEKYIDSQTVTYKDHNIDTVWVAILEVIIEMEYTVTNTDKNGGTVFAEREQAPPWMTNPKVTHSLSIIVRKNGEDIVITCQSKIYRISVEPIGEINRFFNALDKKLTKNNISV